MTAGMPSSPTTVQPMAPRSTAIGPSRPSARASGRPAGRPRRTTTPRRPAPTPCPTTWSPGQHPAGAAAAGGSGSRLRPRVVVPLGVTDLGALSQGDEVAQLAVAELGQGGRVATVGPCRSGAVCGSAARLCGLRSCLRRSGGGLSTRRCWPMRCARSVAWSSTAGFHGRSKWMTCPARVRFSPVPAARTDSDRSAWPAPAWKLRRSCSPVRDRHAAVEEVRLAMPRAVRWARIGVAMDTYPVKISRGVAGDRP